MSVTDLVTDADKRAVTGVRAQAVGAGHDTSDPQTIAADLVVDATGRGSRAPEWLQALGYDAPESEVVNAFLGYATRWYKRPANTDYKWMTIQPNPQRSPRGGVIIAAEGDRWVVTVMGVARDYPPTDEEGFTAFARSLQSSGIYDAIKDAEPLTPVYGYQRTENVWRHYEKLARWPEQFIVMGDAACAFNPAYGQGMTVSAMTALELDKQLRDAERRGSLAGMGQRFQKGMAKLLRLPWTLATSEDFRYPTTEGKRPPKLTRVVQWYVDRVIAMAPDNRALGDLFDGVAQLYRSPAELFQPWIIWKVLTYRPPKDAQTTPQALSDQPSAVS
jgi:2-polyprenyl-6-methoxyphenol hydroxylase-like FAD-dependent oxidoreductase